MRGATRAASSTGTSPAARHSPSSSTRTAACSARHLPACSRSSPPRDAARASAGPRVLESISLAKPAGDWRLLAVRSARPATSSSSRGRSSRARSRLSGCSRELLIAGPLALLLASLAGYGLAAAALRPGRSDATACRGVTAAAPARLPVPPSRDEISRLATTLNEMLGRLRGVARARTALRRRRESRAAHSARAAARGARDRTAPQANARRARGDTAVGCGGDRTTLSARRGPAADRPGGQQTDAAPPRESCSRRAARNRRRPLRAPGRTRRAHDPRRRRATRSSRSTRNGSSRGSTISSTMPWRTAPAPSCSSRVGAASIVELHVEDDGEGFPDEFLPRAFDRFSRADEARGRGGSGLGLSIVELIASAHGGTVGAANKPGGGADVWIALPAARRAARSPILT